MAIGYSIFVDPNNLIIGGVGGIATLLKDVLGEVTILGLHIKSSYIIFILNMILLIFGYFFISRSFFLKTIYASIVYPVYVFIIEIILGVIGDTFVSLANVIDTLKVLIKLRDKYPMFRFNNCLDIKNNVKLDKNNGTLFLRYYDSSCNSEYCMIVKNDYTEESKVFAPGSKLVFNGRIEVEEEIEMFYFNKPGVYLIKK
jgi:uncharacterized membrane-anchored protein YitT (DUF2179 family)